VYGKPQAIPSIEVKTNANETSDLFILSLSLYLESDLSWLRTIHSITLEMLAQPACIDKRLFCWLVVYGLHVQ